MSLRWKLMACVIALGLWCSGLAAAQTEQSPAAGKVLLKAGSELKLRFAQSVDSKTAVVGDLVELVLDEDLRADGKMVARKGMRVLARVTEGKKSEKKRAPGKTLVIELNALMIGGQQVRIAGSAAGIKEKTRTNAGDIASGALAGAVGVISVLSAKHLVIKEGTVIPAYVVSDVEVEPLPAPEEKPAG